MRNVYLLCVEDLKKKENFEYLLSQVSGERRRKVCRCAGTEDRVRSLGAGLLLEFALLGRDARQDGERGAGQCEWKLVTMDQILECLPFGREIRFHYGEYGKPYLEDIPLFFSLSHSGDYAACGLSDQEIGVDIQQHRKVSAERLARRFLSEEERRMITECSKEEEKLSLFCRFWTGRESYGKLRGGGLREGLSADYQADVGCQRVKFSFSGSLPGYSLSACWREVS